MLCRAIVSFQYAPIRHFYKVQYFIPYLRRLVLRLDFFYRLRYYHI